MVLTKQVDHEASILDNIIVEKLFWVAGGILFSKGQHFSDNKWISICITGFGVWVST